MKTIESRLCIGQLGNEMAFRLPFHFGFIFNFEFLIFDSKLVQSTFKHIPFASDLNQFGFSPPEAKSNRVIWGRQHPIDNKGSVRLFWPSV